MSIRDLNDWGAVELKAQTHELSQVDSPRVPQVTPSQIQQGLIDSLTLGLERKKSAMSQAIMYLSIGESGRAREVLTRALLDL